MSLAASRGAPPARRRLRDRRGRALIVTVTLGGLITLANTPAEARPVVWPLVCLLVLGAWYVGVLLGRDRRVPVVELGSMFVLVVTLYGAVPLVNFLAGPLRWGNSSDNRLIVYASTPEDVGAFAWGYVILLLAFVASYLTMRGRTAPLVKPLDGPDRITITALIVLVIASTAFLWVMATFFDLSYQAGYAEQIAGGGAGFGRDLPLVVRQVSQNLRGMLLIEKQMLLIVLISRWRDRRFRYVLLIWLSYEMLAVVSRFGARSEAMMLVMSSVFLYDRFVRPIPLKGVVLGLGLMLTGVVVYGVARDTFLTTGELGLAQPLAASTNEFQAVWATGYDLTQRRDLGKLPPIPWQIYASDLTLLVPSQLLPFEKIDPAQWYLAEIRDRSGSGYMFGVVAQAALGRGLPELAARGLVLGVVFALLHRWYVRRQTRFPATAFYLFVLSWTYYSFRATTFYWVYFIGYRFLPVWLILMAAVFLLKRRRATPRFQPAAAVHTP